MILLSTADVALEIGCSRRTVARIAGQHMIGQRLGRSLAFSAGDRDRLAKLVQGGPGNPLMGKRQPAHYRRTSDLSAK